MNYRFAHLADLHLGGWRDNYLTNLNFITFQKAIQNLIKQKLDFVLFAGDIFNNPMPPLDLVDNVIKECMKLKQASIPLYVIGGSHDYSATGKSFIQLLESANVFKDVGKWESTDKNTIQLIPTYHNKNIRLYGVAGKKNNLEQIQLEQSKDIENKNNIFSFFLFHTTLQDLKPKNSKYSSKTYIKNIPQGFDYYAGGHVHTFIEGKIDNAPLYYPGTLFPNSFKELHQEKAAYLMGELNTENKEVTIKREYIEIPQVEHINFKLTSQIPSKENERIKELVSSKELQNKIVLLEFSGILDGKVSDLDLKELVEFCYSKGASHVLKNTLKITTMEFKDLIFKASKSSFEDIEKELLDKNLKDKQKEIMKSLLALDLEKKEGEKVYQYEERVVDHIGEVLK